MQVIAKGAWSTPLCPVKQRLSADEVSQTFSHSVFRQDRMPGLPLKNWGGNTCYLNSVVQVLVHNPYIRDEGQEHFGRLCNCRSCMLCYLGYCVHSAYGNTAQTELALPAWMIQHGFPKLAAGSEYQQALSPERQEDAHDLIRQWLDAAQRQLKGCIMQAQRTPLVYIFSWVIEDRIECQGCHYQALRYVEGMDLSLPILKKDKDQWGKRRLVASVQEALSMYTSREVMDGKNKYSCPCCSSRNGKQVAHKGFCIYTIPNTLILALKRFHHDPSESPKPRKLYGRIIYGQKLDLKDYLAQNSPDHPSHSNNVDQPSSAEMRLSGVVIHRGGIGQGHYWAYVQDTYDRWWRFDDHRQAEVDIKEVVSHPEAYILWYIRSQPQRVVVDAPEGCEVWPPGTAPPSEPGVAAEEPQTHSGVSVTEAAQWLIAAGSAGHVSGSCTHASVEEIAPEDAGPQAAQVGLGSSSPLHFQSAPPFDIGAWLTDFGLESDRPERMTEIVEVPDVIPTATPMGAPPVPFMDATRSAPSATPVETPLEVSQAASSVISEGSSMEMLAPNLTTTTPMDAPEPQGSNPPELHPVQAAAPNAITYVSPLVEVGASAGVPAADAFGPLPTATSVASAMEEGSPLTLEPSPVAPVPAVSALGHPASQELALAVDLSSPPPSPAALSATPAVAHTPAGAAPAMPMVQPAPSMASSFMQPQKATRQPPKQVTKQLTKQTAAKASGAGTAKQAAVSDAQPGVDPQAHARIKAVSERYAQQMVHQKKLQAAAAAEKKRQAGQPAANRGSRKKKPAQVPAPTANPSSNPTSAAAVVSNSVPQPSPEPVAAASASAAAPAAVRSGKKGKRQGATKHVKKAVAAATASRAAHSGSVAAKLAEREPVEKATAAAARQPAVTGVREAASVSSPAGAAEQKTVNGKAAARSSSGSSAKAAGEKPLSSKTGRQRAAMSAQAEVPTGSMSHAVLTSTAAKGATTAGKSATTSGTAAATIEANTFTKSSALVGTPLAGKAAAAADSLPAKPLSATAVEAAAKKPVATAVGASSDMVTATAGKTLATFDKAATHAVPQAADNKAAAVAATSHQPLAQSTAKSTAAHAAPKALQQSANVAAHTATADQAKKAAGKKPSAGKSAHKAAARKPAGVRLSAVSLSAQSESAAAAREAAARTAQAEGPAAAAEVPSQAASEAGTLQQSVTMSSEAKVPTRNPAAGPSSQPVVKAAAPIQKHAPVSAAAKHTAGSSDAAQSGSGEAIPHNAPAAQTPAQQARSQPATAHAAVKRPAAVQAVQAITQQAAAGKAASLTAAQKPAHQASAAHAGSQATVPSGVQNLKQAANTAAAQLNGTEQAQKSTTTTTTAPATAVPPPQQAANTAAASPDATEQAQKPATTIDAAAALALQQAAATAAASSQGTKQARKQASKQASEPTDTAPEPRAPSLQQAVDTAAPNLGGQAALPADATNVQEAANTAAAKLKGTEEVVRKSGGAFAAPASGFHSHQAADTAAVTSEGTMQAHKPTSTATAVAAVALQQAAHTAAATSEGTEQSQMPTSSATAAAVALQQAAHTAVATLDGSKQVQKPASTAPAAAALDLLRAANTAAAKSNGQKKAAKSTGRATAPAAMSAQKRAGDPAAKQLRSAGQQTSQSSLPPASQLNFQAVPSGSVFRYDRMFPAQTKGTHSDSSNALPRRAEAEASRRELDTQQPPTSGRMAAADLSVNGQKEEVPSATVVRHIGGGSDLDDRMCESKQPRSWKSKWTGALGATWRACKKIAKGVLLAGVLSAACMAILVEYGLTYPAGDDIMYPT